MLGFIMSTRKEGLYLLTKAIAGSMKWYTGTNVFNNNYIKWLMFGLNGEVFIIIYM